MNTILQLFKDKGIKIHEGLNGRDLQELVRNPKYQNLLVSEIHNLEKECLDNQWLEKTETGDPDNYALVLTDQGSWQITFAK
jgi:hypothetical protein